MRRGFALKTTPSCYHNISNKLLHFPKERRLSHIYGVTMENHPEKRPSTSTCRICPWYEEELSLTMYYRHQGGNICPGKPPENRPSRNCTTHNSSSESSFDEVEETGERMCLEIHFASAIATPPLHATLVPVNSH